MSGTPKSFLIIFPMLGGFMLLAILWFSFSKRPIPEKHEANPVLSWQDQKRLISEGAQYRPIKNGTEVDTITPKTETRKLSNFISRRAYNGAPPTIPHPVKNPNSLGEGECLACHEKGGYAQSFKAWVPKTPHPEWRYCRQCHSLPMEEGNFKPSNWNVSAVLKKSKPALEGGPPPIPHEIQYRENCSSCHSGPGALPEIRTSHPERVQCRQCHALQTELKDPHFVSAFQPGGREP